MNLAEISVIFCLVNIFLLVIFVIIQNNIENPPSIKSLLMYLIPSNLIIMIMMSLVGFSASEFLMSLHQAFLRDASTWYIYSIVLWILAIVFVSAALRYDFHVIARIENRRYFFILGFYLLVAFLIWIPFGFDTVGDIETWAPKDYLLNGVPSERLAVEMVSRLSAHMIRVIAHIISPYDFVGMHIVHMVLFACKGIFLFGILKKFRVSDSVSFGIGLLFMIYPTDTEIMSLRGFVLITSVVFHLFALYLFLLYREHPTRTHLIAFFIILFLSVTSNEYGYLHILFVPLLLLILEKRISYRWFSLSFIWYLIPVWHICYYYLVLKSVPTHLGEEYFGTYTTLSEEIPLIFQTITRTIDLLLGGNWVRALDNPFPIVYAVVSLLALVLFALLYDKLTKDEGFQDDSYRRLFSYLLIGFCILLIAPLFFGLIPERRGSGSDWRIYTFGSIGSAIVVFTFIKLLLYTVFHKLNYQLVTVVIFSVFVGVSMNHTLHKHAEFRELVEGRKNFFWSVKDNIADAQPNTNWVILHV